MLLRHPRLRTNLFAALAGLLFLGNFSTARAAAPSSTYLALGDSVAFGFTTLVDAAQSFGDQGYVGLYADSLATQNGGARPDVLNLAVPQETTASFFTGGKFGTLLNLNYAPTFTQSQSALLSAQVASILSSGGSIGPVTIQIGGNDLLDVALDPSFLSATPLEQQTLITGAFGILQTNYAQILTQVRTLLPSADLYVLGYYDPFAGLGPANPLGAQSGLLTQQANMLIRAQAQAFGGTFVDLYPAFVGREIELTNITQPLDPLTPNSIPNYHPNAAGYRVIADQLIAASVAPPTMIPEPATLLLLVGTFPVLGLYFRRFRRPVNVD